MTAAAPPTARADRYLLDFRHIRRPNAQATATAPASTAAQRTKDESPPVRYEEVDTPRQHALAVDAFEAHARSRLAQALLTLQRTVLHDVPAEPTADALQQIRVDAAPLAAALDEVARTVLDHVRRDLPDRFRELGREDVAERLTQAPLPNPNPEDDVVESVGAQLPNDPVVLLHSYLAWTSALNRQAAERAASDLQHRLRDRLLRAYASGLTAEQATRSLRDEFAAYAQHQLDAVARTTVMDYWNSARRTGYDAAGDYVRGLKFLPLMDRDTTPFCRDIEGRSIAKSDSLYERVTRGGPPFWYKCRTTIVPVLSDESGHAFDTDWEEWLTAHASAEGGGFLYGRSR